MRNKNTNVADTNDFWFHTFTYSTFHLFTNAHSPRGENVQYPRAPSSSVGPERKFSSACRWKLGLMRFNHVMKEDVQKRRNCTEKMWEARLWWYDHVIHREDRTDAAGTRRASAVLQAQGEVDGSDRGGHATRRRRPCTFSGETAGKRDVTADY